MAVRLGYQKVYRDPEGFPAWQAAGLPIETSPASPAEASAVSGTLAGWDLLWTLLGVFAGGMALNLTPCVYPLIPITVSYFGARAGAGRRGLLAHGLCYLLGLAGANSALGLAAALGGGMMGSLLQHPAVLLGVAGLMAALASSLFGLWELRLPQALSRAASKSRAGLAGSLFMGLTLGVVAAPCLGPFILGLLTWVAGLGDPWLGLAVFFSLSLGLGLPLLVLGLFSGRLAALPRSGEWMVWVRRLMGWALLGMAAHFLRPLLPEAGVVALFAGLALGAGAHLAWLDRTPGGRGFALARAGAGVAAASLAAFLLAGFFLRGPGVAWTPASAALLEQAAAVGRPAVVDFSAAWCTPCRELEDKTFHAPAVVRRTAGLAMAKADLTRAGNPENEALLARFDVKGVPTLVFLDRSGRERRELRAVDYIPPDEFLRRLDALEKN